MSKRIEKVNQLIKETLSKIIKERLSLKNTVFLTIVKVDTSRDLRYSKVFLSVFPETDSNYIKETLRKEKARIHKELHGKLFMKPLPKLRFVIDETQGKISEIDKIFDKIKKENE